jgi:hypothetical protein
MNGGTELVPALAKAAVAAVAVLAWLTAVPLVDLLRSLRRGKGLRSAARA